MTNQPTRWIEKAQDVIALPSDPTQWTDDQIDQAIAKLNADAIKRVLALALRMAETAKAEKDGAA